MDSDVPKRLPATFGGESGIWGVVTHVAPSSEVGPHSKQPAASDTRTPDRAPTGQIQRQVAEGVGFEPTVPRGTLVFKTSAFDHSATPPGPKPTGNDGFVAVALTVLLLRSNSVALDATSAVSAHGETTNGQGPSGVFIS